MIPRDARVGARGRYLAPTVALTAAGALIAISLFLPYWEMTLVTPADPAGLRLISYLGHLEGPLDTVLASAGRARAARLRELSELERSLAVATVTVICLLVVAATFVHNRWAALLSLPALAFPVIVIADMAGWLHSIVAGISAASGSLRAPPALPLFGRLAIDGVSLETRPGAGLLVAAAASLAVIAGLWLHRSAYKPVDSLVDPGEESELSESIRKRAL